MHYSYTITTDTIRWYSYFLKFFSYFTPVCSTLDSLCIYICRNNSHPFIYRHSRYYIRNGILLYLIEKSFGLNAHLNHLRSILIPSDRIHHFLCFRSIRGNILTHCQRFVLKHWLKISHLLARIKIITKILWHRTTINIPVLIKQMYFINRH